MIPAASATAGALVAMAAALAPAQDAPVRLVPRFAEGAESRYQVTLEQESRSAADPDDRVRRVSQTATLRTRVDSVFESGAARVELRFESLKASVTGFGGDAAFDWPGGEPPEPGEDATRTERVLAALAAADLRLTVAPDGAVTAIAGLGPIAVSAGQRADPATLRALGFFAPAAMRTNLSGLWRVDSSGRPRQPGGSWTVRDTFDLAEGLGGESRADYTLERIADGTAFLRADLAVAPATTGRIPDPGEPALEFGGQRGSAEIEWDVAAGALISRTEERSLTVAARLSLGPDPAAGEPIEAGTTVTTRLRIRRLP